MMSGIWKKTMSPTAEEIARETAIKKELTIELGRTIRSLQQENVCKSQPIYGGESINNICNVLEAIFIHGLKYKLVAKVAAVFGNMNSNKVLEPDFWPIIMLYSHKDVLTGINQLGNIKTDIGRSRAWLRLSLNDGLIVSYIDTILQDKSSLQNYYGVCAYLRDNEQPDIMRQFLEGLSIFKFELSYNSNCLNAWHNKPLVLAGLWSPTTTPQPVMPAVDVVDFFMDQERKSRSRSSTKHASVCSEENSSSSDTTKLNEILVVNEEDNLKSTIESRQENVNKETNEEHKIILPPSTSGKNSKAREPSNFDAASTAENNIDGKEGMKNTEDSKNEECCRISNSGSIPDFGLEFNDDSTDFLDEVSLGNRLDEKCGWSSTFESEDGSCSMQSKEEVDYQSYDSLLQSYNRNLSKTLVVGTPEISEIMTMFKEPEESEKSECQEEISKEKSPDLEYVIIPRLFESTDKSTCHFLSVLGKICPEQGLDAQSYQCHSCGCPIGMIYGKARLCYYDGYNYCYECHENEEFFIPSRIIHNWDFKRYPISKRSKSFLNKIEEEPLINMKLLNPLIYSAVEEMNQLQSLRTQLSFLRAYIFTCKGSIADAFQKRLWPREYLYEHMHLYSISDLLQVPSGALMQNLQKAIAFAKNHVLNCHLCNLKGFFCEVCNSSKVIYPFELDTTYHCKECLTVFHATCMDASKSCPKCERKLKRQKTLSAEN